MPVLGAQAMDEGGAEKVRAVLAKVLPPASAFRTSPQLVTFLELRCGSDAARREGECIKGYTIAVEALGRSADFDPQADPIVRVEASAPASSALNRYYGDDGANDPDPHRVAARAPMCRLFRRAVAPPVDVPETAAASTSTLVPEAPFRRSPPRPGRAVCGDAALAHYGTRLWHRLWSPVRLGLCDAPIMRSDALASERQRRADRRCR